MKRKLLIGTIIILVIAAAFFMSILTTGAAIAVWIYLAWMVLKKKTEVFHEQMEPELAKRRLKMLKASLLVAAMAFVAGIAGVIGHNVVYAATETEEAAFFFLALSTFWLFTLATGGGLAIYLRGRREPVQRNAEISAV